MGSGNSGAPKRTYKEGQKNVSVYLGPKNGWQHDVLSSICKLSNQTESEFFRNLFLEYLAKYKLYDMDKDQPDVEGIDRLRRKLPTNLLPNLLDKD